MSRILIVDDMATLRRMIELFLRGGGHTFDQAGTGMQGLEKMALSPPDLVISDLKMPDMDGAELCAAMRSTESLREVPLILISSSNAADLAERAGAFGFLKKPLDAEALASLVARALAPR